VPGQGHRGSAARQAGGVTRHRAATSWPQELARRSQRGPFGMNILNLAKCADHLDPPGTPGVGSRGRSSAKPSWQSIDISRKMKLWYVSTQCDQTNWPCQLGGRFCRVSMSLGVPWFFVAALDRGTLHWPRQLCLPCWPSAPAPARHRLHPCRPQRALPGLGLGLGLGPTLSSRPADSPKPRLASTSSSWKGPYPSRQAPRPGE
jgi:hypothetical protein